MNKNDIIMIIPCYNQIFQRKCYFMQQYKVLVILPIWVGDIIMSQTLLIFLKAKFQNNITIDVFASAAACNLVKRMSEVDNVIINPFKSGEFKLFKRISLASELRKNKYDEIFVLPFSLKSAIMPFFTFANKRTGYLGESRFILLNNILKISKQQMTQNLPRMIDRYVALANNGELPDVISYPKLNIDQDNRDFLVNKFKLNLNKKIITLCPAAEYGPSKRWSAKNFANLAKLLQEQDYQIFILGGIKDTSIAKTILDNNTTNNNNIIDFTGKTTLADALDLMSLSKCVIANDSGLMHMASSLGVPTIVIYGSSSPKYTPPLNKNARIISKNLDCAPCFKKTCKFNHYNCLNLISVTSVILEINKLLHNS